MIREEICTGKSIEEAIEAACAKLGVNQDDRNVSVEVLEMPVRKLFRTIPADAEKVAGVGVANSKLNHKKKQGADAGVVGWLTECLTECLTVYLLINLYYRMENKR